jgi:para-nitrobenzyl esterase
VAAPLPSVIQVRSGPISGATEPGLHTYLGIPYAAPPVGRLRWRPPQPVRPWTAVRPCLKYGPSCPQAGSNGRPVTGTSEDCLYLNVWTPALRANQRLPVMVFIHGGSFLMGSGSQPLYDGAKLAARGVIVITINYRLGPFGFFAMRDLSAESGHHVSGNYGLLDQIAALRWVRANIAAFGGDAGNVTVFGESAGGMSIVDLLVSPLAGGLFRRAIVESAPFADYGVGILATQPLTAQEQLGERVARRLGAGGGPHRLLRLRRVSAAKLLRAAHATMQLYPTSGWQPVVDGWVLPGRPVDLIAAGLFQRVPLLVGTNADESNVALIGRHPGAGAMRAGMLRVYGPPAAAVLGLFPTRSFGDGFAALSAASTVIEFQAPARYAAARWATAAPTYLYRFTRAPLGRVIGAIHGMELPYVFGTLPLTADRASVDGRLSGAIMGYWTRFAAVGDPNGDGRPHWPEYEALADTCLQLGERIAVVPVPYARACDLSQRLWARHR